MISSIKKQERKTHLMFFGILILVMTLTVGLKVWNGTASKTAIWEVITGIRPLDVALYAGLWYQAIYGKRRDEQTTRFTTLHLND
jgi:hypothetical protein